MPAYKDRRDGRWRYRKWILCPDGRKIRITGTPATDTKTAAESAERQHIDRVLHPERVQATSDAAALKRKEMATVREFAVEFKANYAPRDNKPSSRTSREQILDADVLPWFGDMYLDGIKQLDVDAFIAAQRTRVALKTLNNKLGVLSALLQYAHDNGLIGKPSLRLFVKMPKTEERDIVAVPRSDVSALITATADQRYRVAILLACDAGLRIGEIRGLQWTDIRDGRLTVRRAIDTANNVGLPKGGKPRRVKVTAELAAALEGLPRLGLWVVSTLDGDALGYWTMLEKLNALYVGAGVAVPESESGETMPWHSLRHTFGTEMAALGVPIGEIQKLMGHAKIETTLRYLTVTDAQLDAAIDTLSNRVARGGFPLGQPAGNNPGENWSAANSPTTN